MLRAHLNRVCAAFVLLLMTAPAFAGVGKVMFVLGGASIERGQSAIAAQRGQQLESGDTLVTGLSGRMHVRWDEAEITPSGKYRHLAKGKCGYSRKAA